MNLQAKEKLDLDPLWTRLVRTLGYRRTQLGGMIVLLIVVGVGGSVMMYRTETSKERDRISAEFKRTAIDRVNMIQQGFGKYIDAQVQFTTSLGQYFLANGYPTRATYEALEDAFNDTTPGVDVVMALANVTHAQRPQYERFAMTQGSMNQWITEPNGLNTKAANRSSYMPILYGTAGPGFPRAYAEFMANLDMQALPKFGDMMSKFVGKGTCGTLLIVLAFTMRFVGLMCPILDPNWKTMTPQERILQSKGSISALYAPESFVTSTIFKSSATEMVVSVRDTKAGTLVEGQVESTAGTLLHWAEDDHLVSIYSTLKHSTTGKPLIVSIPQEEADSLISQAEHLTLSQSLLIGDREFEVIVAALPEFVESRSTENPQIVLGFSLGIVVILIVLFILLGVYQHRKDEAAAAAEIQRQQQHTQLVNAAKEAHEKTIAYACHQLRNPLQSIVGSIGFLKERFANNESCREDITAIAGAASDMSRVIDDISDLVKVSVGQLELKLEPVSLLSLLSSVVEKHQQYVNAAAVVLSYHVDGRCEGLKFLLDPDRISQVLSNGVMNSIRATITGSITLTVELEPVEDGSCDLDLPDHQCKLTFKVIDTGCGFGKTDPSKLFHQYFMTHVAAKDGVFGDSSNTSAGKCAAQAGKAVHSESVADSHDRSPVSTFLWTRRTSKVAPSDCDGDSESVATGQRSSDLTLTELDPEVRLRPAVSRPKQLNRSRAYGERTFHSDAPNRQSSTASYCEDEPDGTEADVGVGIGLPMAKQIVDMMGGTISLSRTADNTTVLAFTVSTTAASVSSHGDSKGTAKHRSVARAHRNSASTLTSSSQNESDCELTVEKLSELAQDLQRRDSLNLLPPRKSSAIRWRSVLHAHRVSVLQLARQAPRQDSEAKASVSNDGDGAVDCKSSSPREDSEECGQTIVDSADAAGPATPVPPQVLADKFASGSDANQLVVPLPIKSFAFQVPSSVVAPSHTGLSGMRVLVVDDERAIRRLCQRMLERLGCTCVLLEDGDQVMDTLLSSGYVPRNSSEITGHSAAPFQPFHAVLMDIMMVRSNGVDVVIDVLNRFGLADENDEGMHRIECTPPPFIAMTANTSLTDITNYKHAGFVNVLGKPFDAGALKSKLLTFHP